MRCSTNAAVARTSKTKERDVLTTPIDSYLPLVIALILVCAWAVRGTGWSAAVQCAVPLLVAAMMTIPHERTRLLAYGIIVTAALAITAAAMQAATERWRPAGWLGGVSPPEVILAIAGILLLRWIPLQDVHVVKELIVLAGSLALLFVVRRRGAAGPAGETPALLILIAVLAVAVVTPIPPGKMALFPFAVALLAFITRKVPPLAVAAVLIVCAFFARESLATLYIAAAIVFLVPLLDRIRPLSYAAAFVIFALWPWSGIIARALPVVRNYEAADGDVRPVARALAASDSLDVPVPPHVRHLVVTTSGGQMARLRDGRVTGTIETTDAQARLTTRKIRIGDMADFGFTRRDQFFVSRNSLPRFSTGDIRGYGANAWLWGAGRTAVASTSDIVSLRIIAAPTLPPQSHLQVDAVEFPAR
jgi:hypothetical protein